MRIVVAALALALVAPRAHAKGPAKDDDEEEVSADDDDAGDAAPKKKGKSKAKEDKKPKDDAEGDDEVKTSDDDDKPANRLAEKQDLTGHDLGAAKKTNAYETGRFFVDKSDTKETKQGTLIQGSITSTSFAYTESGGQYGGTGLGSDAASFTRLFTDLRLQTDFRHIAKSRWDARFDGRIRFVSSPPVSIDPVVTQPNIANHIQSGLTGQDEYELRELWVVRNGERSDVFIGRQFIPDLGALKIDGVRVDYASSKKFTLIGFAGLYPFRGSRSITTDYIELKDSNGNNAGQFIAAGGFGAAYRTEAAYGSFGGVFLDPLPIGGNPGETPRIYATSTGYWRYGSQLDLYHFALIDLFGSNAVQAGGIAGTNVSGGLNYKPSPRLRVSASYNRVDTETLNVQANAFLTQPLPTGQSVIQNTLYIKRLATDAVRGSVSAGLGDVQRFELSVAVAYRYRPGFTLSAPDGSGAQQLDPASGVDVYGSFIDRRSFAHLRLGIDGSRSFSTGNVAYQRSEVLALRAFAARELASGKGEWEAEISYASTKDVNEGMNGLMCTTVQTCFGASTGTIISAGGTFYYRFNRDLFGVASAYVSSTAIQEANMMGGDPGIIGLTGFVRAAYRF